MFKWMMLLLREQANEGSAGAVPPQPAETTTTPSSETPPAETPPAPTETPAASTTEAKPSSIAGGIDDPNPAETEDDKEPKADADKKTEDADAPKDVDGNPLPEAYEFKLPDGYKADEALTQQAQGFFKENKFSPTQAQAAIDFHAEFLKKQGEQWINTVNGWQDEAKKDKDFGGKNYDANVGVVRKIISEYGDDDLRQVLNEYGLGNHPAVLRSYLKIGQALGEAGAPKSETSNGGQESLSQVFYGGTHPKG